jgi:hypothetical protein
MDLIARLKRVVSHPDYQEQVRRGYQTIGPPVTLEQVEAAERTLGYPLPPLLKRIYTEVANGGVGPPRDGLNALEELYSGAGYPEVASPWPGVKIALIEPAEPLPEDAGDDYEPAYYEVDRVALASQVYLANAGCQDNYYCDAAQPDFPVILQEAPVAWPIAPGDDTDYLGYFGEIVSPSFDAWIEAWLDAFERSIA